MSHHHSASVKSHRRNGLSIKEIIILIVIVVVVGIGYSIMSSQGETAPLTNVEYQVSNAGRGMDKQVISTVNKMLTDAGYDDPKRKPITMAINYEVIDTKVFISEEDRRDKITIPQIRCTVDMQDKSGKSYQRLITVSTLPKDLSIPGETIKEVERNASARAYREATFALRSRKLTPPANLGLLN